MAYGMRAEDLVFWLDALSLPESADDLDPGGRGVLCRRHADTMVVPRNWTLDDLRDPDLHLFRPPVATGSSTGASSRRRSRPDLEGEQLALGVDHDRPETVHEIVPDVMPDVATAATDTAPTVSAAVSADGSTVGGPGDRVVDGSGDAGVEAWTPSFDASDDLDGLLSARGPLLSRAFRGTDRSKER